jgi:lipopolysaccharide export system permease protein
MLGMTFDLFEHFSDFIEARTPLRDVFTYYVLLLPSLWPYIFPVSLMLAVLASLTRLSKNNEITAMRACGMSLIRLTVPFLAVGLAMSLLLGVVNETVTPWAMGWMTQFITRQNKQGGTAMNTAYDLAYRNALDHRLWMIKEFDTKTYQMKDVDLRLQRDDGTEFRRLIAREVRWLDRQWWFYDVDVYECNETGVPVGAPIRERVRRMNELSEQPKIFLAEVKDVQFFSVAEIRHYVRAKQLTGLRYNQLMTDLHVRLSTPWTCVVVILLGVPFAITGSRRGAFLGVAMALLMFFGYYALMQLCTAMGKSDSIRLWPVLAGWFPTLLFGAIGTYMFWKNR